MLNNNNITMVLQLLCYQLFHHCDGLKMNVSIEKRRGNFNTELGKKYHVDTAISININKKNNNHRYMDYKRTT